MVDNDDNIPAPPDSRNNDQPELKKNNLTSAPDKESENIDSLDSRNINNPDSKDIQIEDPSEWKKTLDEKNSFKPEFKDTTSPGKLQTTGLPIPEALINRTLGSGKIVGYIGSGGMGDVYKIWNESIDRHHAVKLLRHGSTLQQERRFEREIKITASFYHPNIIHIYGAGKWKNYLFLEMELVEGNGLDTIIKKRKKIDSATTIAIGMLVARALHYAHNHTYKLEGNICTGAIHRDLKPSNIMIDTSGKLKLMDFGIARPVSEECDTLTMGGIVGSWAYLPPEQLDGCQVTFRADIYALGEVLYEMLAGKAPFIYENQREFIKLKIKGRYRSLSTDDGTVSAELAQIIDKCMKVNPDSRFQSAAQLEKELNKCLGKITSASPETVLENFIHSTPNPSPVPPPKKPVTKSPKLHQTLYSVIGILIILLIISFATGGSSKSRPETKKPVVKITKPEALIPTDNDTIYSDTVVFRWSSSLNAINYTLLISTYQDFTDTLYYRDSLTDTTYTVTCFQVTGPVFWRIDAYSPSTCISSNMQCLVPPVITLATPILLQPTDGKKECNSTVIFSWNKLPNVNSYQLAIASDEAFNEVLFDRNALSDSTAQVSLSLSTSYYWHVRGIKDTTTGDWSETFSFRTKDSLLEDETYFAIAIKEIENDNPAKALKAIQSVTASSIRKDTIRLRIAEQFINGKKYKTAHEILKTVTVKDSYAEVLRAVILIRWKKSYKKALDVLGRAFSLKTFFNPKEVRGDLFYYRAKAAQFLYQKENNYDNLDRALNFSKEVYKCYRGSEPGTIGYKRFVEAENISSSLGQ